MADEQVQRRLAAILAADVVGYTRLMEAGEEQTIAALRQLRREFFDPTIAKHGGRIFKVMGDGFLVEFGSVLNATRCAVEIQRGMAERNAGVPADRQILFRIGVNLGDLVVDGDDFYGGGVNLASRLEGVARPGGIVCSAAVRDQIGNRLDLDIVDEGTKALKNIAQPVRVYSINPEASANGGERSSSSESPVRETARVAAKLLDPAKCSLAVLPFDNNSGDPEQEHFADGITEDLLIEFSRQRRLAVASRHSCFFYKNKPIDTREAGEKLGVDFIVEGAVRKSGPRIRVTAQLGDCKTGAQVWSNRYDRALDDVFALQDEIVTSILGGLSFSLDEAASNQRRQDPTANISAYGAFLQARTAYRRGEEAAKVVGYLRKAIELDPTYARALAHLSYNLAMSRFRFDSELSDEALSAEANALSDRALAADRFDPLVLGYLANAHLMLGSPLKARQLADAAWELCPRDIETMQKRGFVLAYCGHHKAAVELMEAVSALERHLPPEFVMGLAEGKYMLRDYAGVIETFGRLLDVPASEQLTLAAAYGQLGRGDEAKALIARAVMMSPSKFDPAQWARMTTQMCAERSDADHWLEGFRNAGIDV
jgi:TolB-like protein/class 3 adenylate cyclase